MVSIPRPVRRPHSRTQWLGLGLTAAGASMIPWMYVLARELPSTATVSNWSTAWIGLDAALALGLFGTGALLVRRDARYSLTAAATAALLVMDAWFDVTTSAGSERVTAVAMAGVELPLAVVCAALACRGLAGTDRDVKSPAAGGRKRPGSDSRVSSAA